MKFLNWICAATWRKPLYAYSPTLPHEIKTPQKLSSKPFTYLLEELLEVVCKLANDLGNPRMEFCLKKRHGRWEKLNVVFNDAILDVDTSFFEQG